MEDTGDCWTEQLNLISSHILIYSIQKNSLPFGPPGRIELWFGAQAKPAVFFKPGNEHCLSYWVGMAGRGRVPALVLITLAALIDCTRPSDWSHIVSQIQTKYRKEPFVSEGWCSGSRTLGSCLFNQVVVPEVCPHFPSALGSQRVLINPLEWCAVEILSDPCWLTLINVIWQVLEEPKKWVSGLG